MQRFVGRNVVVTGGSSGIGRAVVAALAREGASVLAWGRDRERLAAVAVECAALPGSGEAHTAMVDLRDLEKVREGIRAAVARFGRLHLLVNCAGIGVEEPVLEVSREAWDDVLAVNLTAAFFASQEAARHMAESGGGAIVNVASTDAFVHDAPFVHYSVSKAGLVMMTRAFAYELGHLGVRCNAVAPGATLTPMTENSIAAGGDAADATREGLRRVPLRRFARPEEQAAVVLFLASDEASYVNGATLLADGGMLQGYWYSPRQEPPVS